jgi:hypothetical protein
VVDDDGSGYAEAGDDWVNAEPDEQAEDNGKGKGKKGGFSVCSPPGCPSREALFQLDGSRVSACRCRGW